MRLAVRQKKLARLMFVLSLAIAFTLQMGCGPEDYQKPIQQFQDASKVVINTTRIFLENQNVVEQNSVIDDAVFQRTELNIPALDKVELISQKEIKMRTDALDALAQYTSNLAQLAQGKDSSAVGTNTKNLSDSLKTTANNVRNLPPTRTGFLDNANYSGLASAAASAIGAVAQLIVEHKARREIEQSIVANDAAVTALIQQIKMDATGSYDRQKSQLGNYGNQLFKDYEIERKGTADPILLLSFARTLKNYRVQESQLSGANPAPAIDKMEKAHEALVAYVKSAKSPKTFAELVTAVQDFVSSATPLGQAVQALMSAY